MNGLYRKAMILGLGAVSLMLIACNKTANSGAGSTAAATTCTASWDGTMRDQNGNTCGAASAINSSCINAQYNANTHQYYNSSGQVMTNCTGTNGYYDGFNSLPQYGTYGSTTIASCSGWSQIYGATYIPVDTGGGVVCMNTAYLQTYNPSYNWASYASQGIPLSMCEGYECTGGGYDYGGYSYGGCSTSISFGLNLGGLGIGAGLCFPGQ